MTTDDERARAYVVDWVNPDDETGWDGSTATGDLCALLAAVRLEERSRCVAWLRARAQTGPKGDRLRIASDLIERRAHLPADEAAAKLEEMFLALAPAVAPERGAEETSQ